MNELLLRAVSTSLTQDKSLFGRISAGKRLGVSCTAQSIFGQESVCVWSLLFRAWDEQSNQRGARWNSYHKGGQLVIRRVRDVIICSMRIFNC